MILPCVIKTPSQSLSLCLSLSDSGFVNLSVTPYFPVIIIIRKQKILTRTSKGSVSFYGTTSKTFDKVQELKLTKDPDNRRQSTETGVKLMIRE